MIELVHMENQHANGNEETNYLKRPILEETDIPNPLQDPVNDPNVLFHFLRDVHDSTVPKVLGIFLNKAYCSLGNEPLALGEGADPTHFSTRSLVHFFGVFYAERFIVVTNHVHSDASPTEGDRKLIKRLERVAEVLEGDFADYVIVSGDTYWSMNVQNGTACHCGQQHYFPDV